jgi:hypothetical protein
MILDIALLLVKTAMCMKGVAGIPLEHILNITIPLG